MNKLQLSNYIEQTLRRSSQDFCGFRPTIARASRCTRAELLDMHRMAKHARATNPDFRIQEEPK